MHVYVLHHVLVVGGAMGVPERPKLFQGAELLRQGVGLANPESIPILVEIAKRAPSWC